MEVKEKIIYTKWVAFELRKKGFPIKRVQINPNKPQFDCWVFDESEAFSAALASISNK